jgi:VanZ family protein
VAGYAVAVTALLLMPIPAPSGSPGGLDKAAHALLMGILAVLVWQSVPLPPRSRGILAVIATVAYAGAMELGQGLTPYRSTEVADVIAGGLGAVLAIGIVLAASRRRPQNDEAPRRGGAS